MVRAYPPVVDKVSFDEPLAGTLNLKPEQIVVVIHPKPSIHKLVHRSQLSRNSLARLVNDFLAGAQRN